MSDCRRKPKKLFALLQKMGLSRMPISPPKPFRLIQSAEEASRFAATMDLTDEYNESQRVGRDMEI